MAAVSGITESREQMKARLAELAVRYTAAPQDLLVVKEIAGLYWRLEDWENSASYYDYAFSLDNSETNLKFRAEAARENISGQQNAASPVEIPDKDNDVEQRQSRVRDLRPKQDDRQGEAPDNAELKPAVVDQSRHAALNLQATPPREPVEHIPTGSSPVRPVIAAFFNRLRHLNRADCRRWASSAAALFLLLFVVWTVGGKMRGEVWRYYTDEQDLQVDAARGQGSRCPVGGTGCNAFFTGGSACCSKACRSGNIADRQAGGGVFSQWSHDGIGAAQC